MMQHSAMSLNNGTKGTVTAKMPKGAKLREIGKGSTLAAKAIKADLL